MVHLFRVANPGPGSGFSPLLPTEEGGRLPIAPTAQLRLRIERACAGALSERERSGGVALALAAGDQALGWQVEPAALERVDAPTFDLLVETNTVDDPAAVGVVMLVNVSKPDHTLHGLCDLMVGDASFEPLLAPLDPSSRARLLGHDGPALPRVACALALAQVRATRAYASDFLQQEHALLQGRLELRWADEGPARTGALVLETSPRGAPAAALAPGSLRLLKPAFSLCRGRQGLEFVEDLPHVVLGVAAP